MQSVDGYQTQTYTVEFQVPGSLDGVTLSPAIQAPAKNDDPQQIFRPLVLDNLGLIDPDYVVSALGPDKQGTRGNRWISVFWLEAADVGAAGARLEVVDAVDDTVVIQEDIANLAGLTTFYRRKGILVPQGSMLRISGFPVAATPHKVRITIQYLSLQDLLLAQKVLCECDPLTESQFDAYFNSAPPPVIGGVLVFVPLDFQTFVPDPTVFTHVLSSAVVTVNKTGRYEITADVGAFQRETNVRSTVGWAILRNLVIIPGTLAITYHRDSKNGLGTASTTVIVDLDAGDTIVIAATRIAGTGNLLMSTQSCSLSMELKVP